MRFEAIPREFEAVEYILSWREIAMVCYFYEYWREIAASSEIQWIPSVEERENEAIAVYVAWTVHELGESGEYFWRGHASEWRVFTWNRCALHRVVEAQSAWRTTRCFLAHWLLESQSRFEGIYTGVPPVNPRNDWLRLHEATHDQACPWTHRFHQAEITHPRLRKSNFNHSSFPFIEMIDVALDKIIFSG